MPKHLVFYDGECGLCDHTVQLLLKVDRKKLFAFAPLQGKTAKDLLQEIPQKVKNADSLILVENYQTKYPAFWIYGKGAFRIAWQLGGIWSLIGWIHLLPAFLYDWAYRFIAKNRKYFFSKHSCKIPDSQQNDRFLP